jgi:hypothetical protein
MSDHTKHINIIKITIQQYFRLENLHALSSLPQKEVKEKGEQRRIRREKS